MLMADLVTKIKYHDSNDNLNHDYDIGVDADHVFIQDENSNSQTIHYTLKQIYTFLKEFFSKKMFMIESSDEPENPNVIVWNKVEQI